ncbi:tetratricopeptide repeat protein [Nevskia soli]|uniref:tetratricopeptide repeat protein n=1 Tax=Nevskia soli TaxID=418856 RepID=UPI000689EAEE|nr:tetratricopeptide repeat protein [Nevskia soli]
MHQKTLGSLLLASAIGLSGWAAIASADEPGEGHPPPIAGPGQPFAPDAPPHGPRLQLGFGNPGFGPGAGPGPGMGGPGFDGPADAVIHTLIEIERLYREEGRSKEVVSLYQGVLGKTKDPLVRHFAYEAIAHAQLRPADTDKAVATLKQSLDESLQHLNELPPPGGPGRDRAPGQGNNSGEKAP